VYTSIKNQQNVAFNRLGDTTVNHRIMGPLHNNFKRLES